MDFRKLAQEGAIAIQGGSDSFSEAATRRYFGPNVDIIYCNTFSEAFDTIKSGLAVGAFIPTENSLAGYIGPVFELMPTAGSYAVAEEYMQITLCAHIYREPGDRRGPQAILDDIRDIYSHPVALKQCHDWVNAVNKDREKRGMKPLTAHEYEDTALAAEKIKRDKNPHQAAIASKQAGIARGLYVLSEGIQDRLEENGELSDNYTRFALFVPNLYIVEPKDGASYTTTLYASIEHQPGALNFIIKCLSRTYPTNTSTQ